MSGAFCVLLWLVLPCTLAAGHLNAEEIAGKDHWLTFTLRDDICPGNKTMDGYTSATNMSVFASRFNYTMELQAIKVMIRGNLDKPRPTVKDPLVASVRNWAGGHTITVPYNVYGRHGQLLTTYDHATRFLCPGEIGQLEYAIVSVSAGNLPSTKKFHFQVTFQRVGHWSLQLDMPEKLVIKPSDPAVFAFRWPKPGPSELTLRVDTVQQPEVCTSVALQPRICPLAQTVAELTATSIYFTMTASGALTVSRQQFPDGFFLLVLPRDDDLPCDLNAPEVTPVSREKTVRVTLTAHQLPVGLLAAPGVLALLLLLGGAASACLLRRDLSAPRLDLEPEPEPERHRRDSLAPSEELLLDGHVERESAQQPQPPASRCPVSLLLAAGFLLLALGGEAVLAALGALGHSGDMDVCYRNELCSLTKGGVPGVNHVIARLPYVGAGLGLLLAVRAQKGIYRKITVDNTIKIGAHHEWSLLDATALAMVLQGLLSALQSVCPAPTNAPLDVALVYFTLTALACKLFQTRRGHWAPGHGHYAPLLLTGALVLVELVKQRAGDVWWVWLVLGLLHIAATVIIGTQLYVLGEVSAAPSALRRVWDESYLLQESTNYLMYRATFILVLLANLALAIAAGAAKISEFSHYAMLFFAIHGVLYLLYYLPLKMVKSEERAGRAALALLLLGVLLLLAGVITLVGWSPISTSGTPAASRLRNSACLADGLFDSHDLWHLLMAPALLCLALGLLLLDDDLLLTPRMEIPRF